MRLPISPRFIYGLSLLAIGLGAQAQVLPGGIDAQEQQRQQERERALRQQQETGADVRLPRPPETAARLPATETPCFTIARIELQGEAAERFQWALTAADPADDPATGRCLGTGGISVVMTRLQNALIAAGYVTTRVLAPPQNLSGGTLTLNLIPGRIRAIHLTPDGWRDASLNTALPMQTGDILNLRDIEQALENFKRVPTADADIQIAPAEGPDARPGESDLAIRYKQDFPLRLSLTADDSGFKATGKYQGGVTLAFDNPFTLNDLFYLNWTQSITAADPGDKGTRNGTVHYSLPFGDWLLGFTASHNRYHQSVAGANQTYSYSGESNNSELRLTRLLHRNATHKASAWIAGWTRDSKNYIDDTEILIQRRRMAGWSAGLTDREYLGAATLDTNLAYKRGTHAFDALPAPEEAFGEGTAQPRIVTADITLNAPFALAGQSFRYQGTARGQWNDTPLVPQDRFAIGNRYTVRGFDGETTLSAEQGWYLRNDLALVLGGNELYLGLDHGEVAGPSSHLLVGKHLTGAVVGLRGVLGKLNYDFFVGGPLERPRYFVTAAVTTGFNLILQF